MAVTGAPLRNTTAAASGSAYMLKVAAGVMLPPTPHAPSITTISAMAGLMSGAALSAAAKLVSGPRPTSVMLPGGAPRSVSIRYCTACVGISGPRGSCSAGPSMPVLPCTSSAKMGSRTSGRG